ncbi:MAG: glycoside hydrolase family 43 protein [Clostridiales bacterium]|nr:glycoside hydrolase family 43 protein [Clostridiales bacterium]
MIEKYSGVLIPQRADPCILLAPDSWYYFTASVPAFDCVELRRAKSIEELPSAPTRIVWRKHIDGIMSQNIWAPEIHLVDGVWCIYFAAAGQKPDDNGVFSHRIYCLQCDGDPMLDDWVEAGQVNTGWESFALDATTFTAAGKRYFVWAQRNEGIRGNSNLYIAEMLSATELKLPGILLSVPEYDWECIGYRVNEGPSVLKHNGKLFLTYSASATDEHYAMGMLTADEGSDLLNRASWHKSPVPVMVTDPAHGIYGPGHNSFTKAQDGRDLLVFHARPYPGFEGTPLSDPNRHCHVWPVVYDEQDRPVFN